MKRFGKKLQNSQSSTNSNSHSNRAQTALQGGIKSKRRGKRRRIKKKVEELKPKINLDLRKRTCQKPLELIMPIAFKTNWN